MSFPLIRSSLAIAAATLVAACGGGGDSGAPANQNPPVNASTQLNGIAATGAPVANGRVAAQCASGASVTGSTDANGAWSLTLNDQKFPCLVTVSGGSLADGVELHSVALDASALNVTPLTEIITAGAVKAAASEKPTDASALKATLASALDRVNASLTAAGYTPLSGDPLTSAFEPKEGDVYDDLIAKLMRSLADEDQTLAGLAAAFAAGGSDAVAIPNTHVFKADELAAMPQLNKASLAVDSDILKMKLEEGLSAVGSFVGGGAGNKAVLQLPGLAGTKLKDLKGVTLEVAGPVTASTTGGAVTKNVYTYMNFTVDLKCGSEPALGPDAKLEDIRARHRIFIFDPFVNFIQHNNQISATDPTKVQFDRSTPGWRVSAGTSVGQGVLVGSSYLGNETLEGFDFETYPDACIVDGVTGDGGMYRDKDADAACNTSAGLAASAPASCGKPYKGAIVVLGDSGTEVPVEWKVKKVRMNVAQPRNFVFQ